ncbi:hypothetical protein [Rhizobium sp. BK176]|uniref:hypothetical protein n=1 Tax=Rhizobium sp. BK176 TaxID=2587071 RepID=UPI002168ED28|nr:hypothetical protein [Rhizobium sp. BK176]MCS4089319.1 hypothetical protein [Rhizobium sp. BK176]
MTTNIDRKETFLGHSLTKLKTLLLAWEKGNRHPGSLGRLSNVSLSSGAVTAVISDAYDRGLFETSPPFGFPQDVASGHRFLETKLSDAGLAVASASARKRSSKDAAGRVLNDLIERADALNRDPKGVQRVEKIWVFGSFIDPAKSDVGDLDIVVETSMRAKLFGAGIDRINHHIEKHYPGVVPESIDWFRKERHWLGKMLYGPRRHALIAESSLHILKDLNCPCRLAFDASRGGIVPPIDYPHHPQSTGRGDNIRDRLVMPQLGEPVTDFRVTDASVFHEVLRTSFRPITSKDGLSLAVSRLTGDRVLDGRNGFAVDIQVEGDTKAVLYVSRSLEMTSEDQWNYRLNVESIYQSRDCHLHDRDFARACGMIGDLFNADVARLANHRERTGVYPEIFADIELCQRTGRMAGFVEEMRDHFVSLCGDAYRPALLPEKQRYGIEYGFQQFELGYGYTAPHVFDNEDWGEVDTVDKDDYLKWLSTASPTQYRETIVELAAGSSSTALAS